jgi:hypothetical protein
MSRRSMAAGVPARRERSRRASALAGSRSSRAGMEAGEAGVVGLADVDAVAEGGAAADEDLVGDGALDDGDAGAGIVEAVGAVGIGGAGAAG